MSEGLDVEAGVVLGHCELMIYGCTVLGRAVCARSYTLFRKFTCFPFQLFHVVSELSPNSLMSLRIKDLRICSIFLTFPVCVRGSTLF